MGKKTGLENTYDRTTTPSRISNDVASDGAGDANFRGADWGVSF